MADLLVVQFPHPGGEHGQDRPGRKDWNLSAHRRKFMKSSGRWLTRIEPGAAGEQGDLVFWGEWEPPSRVVEVPSTAREDPRFLHEPLWAVPRHHSAQNTDPYVFGDRFLYSNCKQNTRRGPRRTQRLTDGSMLLFGSFLANQFVLDTVLVVARSRPLDEETLLEPDVDPVFRTVTGDLLVPRDDMMTFRLYEGATPQNSVAGMFSFVPCLPFDRESPGFRRPAIEIEPVINAELKMGLKFTDGRSTEEVGSIWGKLVEQVLDQGLALGVSITTPDFDGGESLTEPIANRERGSDSASC